MLGCLEYSEEFVTEFITRTGLWNDPSSNEMKLVMRPWVHLPRYKEVDALLEKHVPEAFERRRLEEYAVGIVAAIARGEYIGSVGRVRVVR